MKTSWQCQLCDAWVEGFAISAGTVCECTRHPNRGMQPEDAWPMPDDDDDEEATSREPAPVGGETWT